jgi:hypothetical protein
MTIGGIPYYLSKLDKKLSVIQNIEKLAFVNKGFLLYANHVFGGTSF